MRTETNSPASHGIDDSDLQSLDRLTQVRRFSDGSMDVIFGLSILLVGICWLLDMVPLGAAVPAIMVPLWVLLHRNVVLPRTGVAEPTEERRRADRAGLGMTIVLGVIIFVQVTMAWFGRNLFSALPDSLVDIFLPGLPAALVGLFALVGGLLTRQKEGFHYAQALIFVGVIGGMNGLEPGTILTISGGLILLLSVRKFTSFLSSHPRLEHA